MKHTKKVTDKINEVVPTKVIQFMKENDYHPYYTTQEHGKLNKLKL